MSVTSTRQRRARPAERRPESGSEASPRSHRAAWFILLLALAANAPILSAGYIFDDHPIIEDSVRVNEFQLARIWSSSYWGSQQRTGEYRPFVLTTYALQNAVLGSSAWHFHLVNLLLHALVSLSVLLAGRAIGLGEAAAVVAAALFAVHPIHLDAIAPIVGRAELFAALAVTGSMLCWLRIRASGAPEVRWLLGLLGVLAIGAFSKENALAAIPILIAVECFVVDRAANRTSLARAAGVALAVVGVYLLVRIAVLGALLPGDGPSFSSVANPLVGESTGVRLITAVAIFGHYIRLFFWPTRLSPDYSFDSLPVVRSPGDPMFWLPLALIVALLFATALAARRRPAVVVAAVTFAAPYAIVANAVFLIGTMLAERLLYLPSIGICWAIGLAAAALALRVGGPGFASTRRLGAVVAVPILALGIASFERARTFGDEERLYREALLHYPRNTGLWLTLGELALRSGRYDLGIERMGRVIEIVPEFVKAWSDRGTMLAALGRFPEARSDLRRALELDPEHLLSIQNLAAVERQLGNGAEARALDERAAAILARREAGNAARTPEP